MGVKIAEAIFNNCFFNKTVIVTGNTGFKGSWLTLLLKGLGANVFGISKDIPSTPSMFEELGIENKITHYRENICDLATIHKLFQKIQPDFVFHLAAQSIVSKSYESPVDTMNTNIIGTVNILESLRFLEKPSNAVMITSDKCYDNIECVWGYRENDRLGGKDPYSASKGAAELMIKTYFHSYFSKPESPIKVASVRAGNVIGGGDWAISRIVPDCMRAWSKQNMVTIRNPNSTRPWQHVLEPLSGYLCVAQAMLNNAININGESFNFGPNSDQNHSVIELIQALRLNWNSVEKEPFYRIESTKNFHEAGLLKLNCDKALHYLNWRPVLDFNQTAVFTGLWYDKFYNQPHNDIYSFTDDQIKQYIKLAKVKKIAWAQ